MQNRDVKSSNTDQDFFAAFWQNYEKKPAEKITVDQLCRTAGYNRSTFYNHFTDIYDLQSRAVDSMLLPVKEFVMSIEDLRVLLRGDVLKRFLSSVFEKRNRYLGLLFKRHDEYLIRQKFKENVFAAIRQQTDVYDLDPDRLEIILEYQISAVLGVAGSWYQKEDPGRMQDMIDMLFEISSNGVFNVFRSELGETGDTGES